MKQTILFFVFSVFSALSFAQRSTNWTIGVNASSCLLNDDRLTLSKVAIETGYQWNGRWSVNTSVGYVQNLNMAHPEGDNFQGVMNSVSFSSRLLHPESKFSPFISIELGNIFFSNAKGALISRDFVICTGAQDELMGTFRSFSSFARIKYMLDIRLKGLNFRVGPNYNLSTIRMQHVIKDDDYRNVLFGFGLEMGLQCTIKSKQQSAVKRKPIYVR